MKRTAPEAQPARSPREPWPFRRLAVVLSGGGALGAYEVGVFRALEKLGVRPSIVAGVSVGAFNAVAWVAHGFTTAALARAWRDLRPSAIGMRWSTLALRAVGGFLAAFALVELVLTVAADPSLNLASRFGGWRPFPTERGFEAAPDFLAWTVLLLFGLALTAMSRRVEQGMARAEAIADPARAMQVLRWSLIVGTLLFIVAVATGIPWPRRAHATLLLLGLFVWLFSRSGPGGEVLRRLALRLLPETAGRGLWSGAARRELLKEIVRRGDPSRLVSEDVHLIVSACAFEDGRMHYFVNWPDSKPAFRDRIQEALGEVIEVLRPRDVIEAAVASGAIPVLFEPVRFRGREYLDAGLFTNQPLHAVVADGADAILLVLVSPSASPRRVPREATLVELGAHLQDVANWRDLQAELQRLPPRFQREGDPARVCVVEPDEALPVTLLGFDPQHVDKLIAQGERDAWRALERAGWLR